MSQPARLTGDLLARKGQAFPTGGFAAAALGLVPPLPAPQARPRPCGADPSSSIEQARSWPPAGPGDPKAKGERVALTLRLDPARHTRLRIFAARRRSTSQDLLIEALDAYLQACGPDCACMQGERCRS